MSAHTRSVDASLPVDTDQPIGEPVPGWTARPFPEPSVLDGQFAQLQPLNEQHSDMLFTANAADRTGRMWTYLPYGPFVTLTEYSAWVRERSASRDPSFYAVIDKHTMRPAGVASLLRIDTANGVVELGHLAYAPSIQGTRVSTEVAYLFMLSTFALGYRRFEWKCDALNAPSRRAAQRFGLSFEGVFRQAVVVKGRNRDTAWYAATDHDWTRLRPVFERWLDSANFGDDGHQRTRLSDLTRPLLVRRG